MLPWKQHSRHHSVSFVMYIFGAKFEELCPNIPRDIQHFYCLSGTTCIFDVITFLIWIIQKRKKIFQKEKRHSSLFVKPFK